MDVNAVFVETEQMTTIAIKFGKAVRQAREKRGLSQEALAELANLNRNYLGEIERGIRSPSIESMKKISDALGDKLSELIKQCEQFNE